MNEALPRGVSRRKYVRGVGKRQFSCHRGKLFFVSRLRVAGRLHLFGYYRTADEAGRAYDEALYLLSDENVVPWYLRFNDELTFLDPTGEQLRPKHEIEFRMPLVASWWERTFSDANKRVACRSYYTALGISLERARVVCAPRRSSRAKNTKGVRRGPYNPRLSRVHKELATLHNWTDYEI